MLFQALQAYNRDSSMSFCKILAVVAGRVFLVTVFVPSICCFLGSMFVCVIICVNPVASGGWDFQLCLRRCTVWAQV